MAVTFIPFTFCVCVCARARERARTCVYMLVHTSAHAHAYVCLRIGVDIIVQLTVDGSLLPPALLGDRIKMSGFLAS